LIVGLRVGIGIRFTEIIKAWNFQAFFIEVDFHIFGIISSHRTFPHQAAFRDFPLNHFFHKIKSEKDFFAKWRQQVYKVERDKEVWITAHGVKLITGWDSRKLATIHNHGLLSFKRERAELLDAYFLQWKNLKRK
jgi:hypothetical protein